MNHRGGARWCAATARPEREHRAEEGGKWERQHGDYRPPTEAERARQQKIYAEFCKSYEKAAVKETLKLDPELVAQVPDNPKSIARQKMGA